MLLDFAKNIDIENIPREDEWQKDIASFLEEWYSESKSIITRTSGSTGTPKDIYISKEAMQASARMTGEFFSLKEGDMALLCMPSKYIGGKMMLVRAIVWGLKLTCIKPSSIPLRDVIGEYEFSAMTPMQVANSLEDLSRIKKLIIGGASISQSLLNQLKEFDTEIYESFGMTETISHIALKKVSQGGSVVFNVLPDVNISQDARGCLVITASFLEEEIVTNDVVEIVSDSKFKWIGRIDNVINTGGVKIYPEEVERQLKSIIDREFIISSQKDEVLGNKLVILIEGEEDELLFQKIQDFVFDNKYQKPKEFIFISNFERTKTGKILRNINLK